ncbi:hypothetical protein E2C01_019376 [Portunus trituberculatus]|uniref:Uncharacterized protein n=1 Tax=Portunus trituberculatus TaxID=210409 RepID=A0A5B7DX18_PORTR|nr:hypothetical protein [Portunus trituberculatus]
MSLHAGSLPMPIACATNGRKLNSASYTLFNCLETRRFPNHRGCKIFLATARFASMLRYSQTYYDDAGRCTMRFEGTERHYWLYASQ